MPEPVAPAEQKTEDRKTYEKPHAPQHPAHAVAPSPLRAAPPPPPRLPLPPGPLRWLPVSLDVSADYFALRKNFVGTRWVFTEGRNLYNPASHCDIAWAGGLATEAHLSRVATVGARVG